MEESEEKMEIDSELDARLLSQSPCTISTFSQLLDTLEKLERKPLQTLNPDQVRLRAIGPAIWDLASMVGQAKVKEALLTLILYASQNLHPRPGSHRPSVDNAGFLNVCIFAPPGTGKTKLTQIIADLFYYSGFLPHTAHNTKKRYIVGNRSNLIGGYTGQTPIITQHIINQCITEGKVLLLDELYSLGSNDGSANDQYAKECINTINQNLSEYPDRFRVIAAGYEELSVKQFFNSNEGLARRFTQVFKLEVYQPKELREMFLHQLMLQGYALDHPQQTATEQWFRDHKEDFCFAGGDIMSLVFYARLRAGRRAFGLPMFLKPWITQPDLDAGLVELKEYRVRDEEKKKQEEAERQKKERELDESWRHLYT